jgi:uncharacterized membrane protein
VQKIGQVKGKGVYMKSKAKLKMVSFTIIAWTCAWFMNVKNTSAISDLLLFAVFAGCAFLAITMRCEKCGTLIYRKTSKEHGTPHLLFFLPGKHCEVCGIERW